MKKSGIFCCLFVACILLTVSCKKDLPAQPDLIPALVLGGSFWAPDSNGKMEYLSDLPQGQILSAFPSRDKKAKFVLETKSACSNSRDDEIRNYVHVSAEISGRTDVWVQEDALILNARPVLLVDAMPFAFSINEDQSHFSDSRTTIPANTIVALHEDEISLDYLKVSYLNPSDDKKSLICTGYIPNPHPFLSTSENDFSAIRLYSKASGLPLHEKDAKKALLDEALALENLSPKVRTMIQAERKKLDPPKNVSYERVRIPTSLQGGSKSRYGVNMSELLKGGTEDPWAKQK